MLEFFVLVIGSCGCLRLVSIGTCCATLSSRTSALARLVLFLLPRVFRLLFLRFEYLGLVRLQLLLLPNMGVFGVQEVRELLAFIIAADQVHLGAFLRVKHSVLLLASEPLGRPRRTLAIDAVCLWCGLWYVRYSGQVALISRFRVAHPLLGVLVPNSALLNQRNDYIFHELLSLIHEQAKAVAVDLLEAVAGLDQLNFVQQWLRLQEGALSTLDKVTLPVLQLTLRVLVIKVVFFIRVLFTGHLLVGFNYLDLFLYSHLIDPGHVLFLRLFLGWL